MNPSLLIELCTEELPPKSLSKLSASFCASLTETLLQNELITASTEWQAFASPRRLGILIKDVSAQQQDRSQQRKGPALQAAYNDAGEPTKAAMGFARSCGVEVADLVKSETDQGTWLTFEQSIKGKNITEIAQEALDTAIKNLPIAKRMRWGNSTEEFVRPVHRLLALHGSTIIELTAFGLQASKQTLGHRFHCSEPIDIETADSYETTLLGQGKVVANSESRKELIRRDAEQLAKNAAATVILGDDLLEEVTGLVEWPVTIMGEFDTDFLNVPTEALVASMKDHQKYFHLVDSSSNLLPHFITVSNIESQQPDRVVSGNERVLRARLADGMFFWEQDKATPLAAKGAQLGNVLFHVKLGSVADKVQRIADVAQFIGERTGANNAVIKQAASLCKNDLVSDMVGEFPSLQGTMGRYYAAHDGETSLVADTIEQHYWPKFAGDKLAKSPEAIALAMADRTDTLVGIFATGEKPTGVKDPYALRRASLGI
ncbi:MAG: glycyl-tRNA synthetase beta chain, partial [Saprospiraceae bacterium]